MGLWPKYRDAYIRAFEKGMARGRIYDEHGGMVLGGYANADIMAGMLITGARIQIATDSQTADYNYDDAGRRGRHFGHVQDRGIH